VQEVVDVRDPRAEWIRRALLQASEAKGGSLATFYRRYERSSSVTTRSILSDLMRYLRRPSDSSRNLAERSGTVSVSRERSSCRTDKRRLGAREMTRMALDVTGVAVCLRGLALRLEGGSITTAIGNEPGRSPCCLFVPFYPRWHGETVLAPN
jgi:hypothetical protein